MSKVFNYMILSTGLILLLKFAGIPSGADAFITWLGLSTSASGISLGTFFIGVIAIFSIGTAGSIVIGFLTKSQSESFIVAPIAAGIFTSIVSTFVSVINYTVAFGWIYYVTYLIFVPWLVGFAIAIIQFWRGTD